MELIYINHSRNISFLQFVDKNKICYNDNDNK